MVNAVIEMFGKTTFEHRKAHARKGSQLGYTLCLVVVVAHEDTEIVLRLNHRLEEVGMFGRRVEHLDHHKKLGGLHPVVADAVEHLADRKECAQKAFYRRMHRKHGDRFGRNDRVVGHHLVENVLLAEFDPMDERQHDHMRLVVLSRHHEAFAAGETHALFRRNQTHRVVSVFQPQRSRHHEKDAHHAVRGERHPFSGCKRKL